MDILIYSIFPMVNFRIKPGSSMIEVVNNRVWRKSLIKGDIKGIHVAGSPWSAGQLSEDGEDGGLLQGDQQLHLQREVAFVKEHGKRKTLQKLFAMALALEDTIFSA